MPPTTPPYIPWLIAALVVLLLLWLAWHRPNRQRLLWRVLASVVAGVSLVFLVFPPATQQAVSPSTAILLTEGYDADTLRHLLRQSAAAPQVYSYQTAAANATAIPHLYMLRQEQPGLSKVHLLGHGLAQEELEVLKGVQVQAHLSVAPSGMAAIHWPESIHLGEAVEVTGSYMNLEKGSAWLYLQAAGQAQDSVEVKADSTFAFRLRYRPKQAGRFIYKIKEKRDGEITTLGQVPVQVKPVKELGILLLASSPQFEFRFLKNHLAELHHRVALRTTVSKNMSQSEWLNMPRQNLGRLTPKLLQQFDVVITEPQALQQLSAGERANIQHAVSEDGLGVLTITNAPDNNRSTSFFTLFQAKRLSQQDTRSTRASWTNTAAVATASPYALEKTTAVTSLVTEQNNHLLAGARDAGWGKVAISLVPQTYPWLLQGSEEVYASYWANLLSAVAKQEVQEKFWQLASPQVPHPNQPLTLTFTDYTATGPVAPSATITSLADSASAINLPLAQDPLQPMQFSGTFWPRRSGWHRVQTPDAPSYFFFVQDSADWNFATIQARRQATQAYAAKQDNAAASDTPVAYKEEPVPLIWFFALFVLSSGFLWLEEKI